MNSLNTAKWPCNVGIPLFESSDASRISRSAGNTALTRLSTGIAALVTGYLGLKNIKTDPNNYGGRGLAIGGMVTGGLFMLLGLIYWILIIVGIGLGSFSR